MTEVVSVKFKSKGKVYFFDPNGLNIEKGQEIIVETAKGTEFAECVWGNHSVNDDSVIPPLRPVVRIATEEDMETARRNKEKEAEAFEICREKILAHGLDMKLVDVEYSFDGSKILFCFTSDGRVDFRDLVKDLAATFKMRIELRQIGVRDEARMLGGLGICGKPFCCAQFLDDFEPVSIKMAKTQGLSLNPTKISGTCGRLMCCLKYEQEAYEDLVKKVPKVDSFVETPDGKGMVTDVNLLRSKVRVKLENQNDLSIHTYEADEIAVLGGKAQRLEYLDNLRNGRITEEPRIILRRQTQDKAPEAENDTDFMPEAVIKSQSSSPSNESSDTYGSDIGAGIQGGIASFNYEAGQTADGEKNQQFSSDEASDSATGEKTYQKRRHRGTRGGRGRRKPDSKSGGERSIANRQENNSSGQKGAQAENNSGQDKDGRASGKGKPYRKPYYRRRPNKKSQDKQKSGE